LDTMDALRRGALMERYRAPCLRKEAFEKRVKLELKLRVAKDAASLALWLRE
jgi:hypothetical protein